LKELGPGEDTRARDYRVVANAEALAGGCAKPPGAVAVAIAESAEGGFSLDTIAWQWRREKPAVPADLLPALKPFLEDESAPKIAAT